VTSQVQPYQRFVALGRSGPVWFAVCTSPLRKGFTGGDKQIIVVVALAVVSLIALGVGWSASTRSKELEQSLATQAQQTKQNDDVVSQRLAKSEDTNAQLQGELSVVTDKMKLTEGELSKARAQAKKIKQDDAQEL
jgi:uncharacterized protein HemX